MRKLLMLLLLFIIYWTFNDNANHIVEKWIPLFTKQKDELVLQQTHIIAQQWNIFLCLITSLSASNHSEPLQNADV